MRSKLKLSRSLEFIPAFFKEQQVINTRGGANLAPPGPDRVKNVNKGYISLYLSPILSFIAIWLNWVISAIVRFASKFLKLKLGSVRLGTVTGTFFIKLQCTPF